MKNIGPIKVGIVGLGRSGWDLHVKELRAHECYKIDAVCDIRTDRLKQAMSELGCQTYSDFKTFLRHPGLELVIIASLTKDHFWMAKEALKKGFHIVLEKPLAASLKEILALRRIAMDAKRIISPYYNFRFSNDFVLVKSILKEDLIGEPFLIKRQVGYFNRRDDWQSKRSEIGGILNAATIHSVDQVLQLVGQFPKDVWCDLRHLVSEGDTPDHSKIILRFPNNCIGDIEVSWVEALNGCDWLIYGRRGAIRVYENSLEVKWFIEDEITKRPLKDRSYYSSEQIQWKKRSYEVKNGFTPDYYNMVAMAIRGEGVLPVALESAVEAMKVLEQCIKRKRPLSLL